jgi:hypothetical protein
VTPSTSILDSLVIPAKAGTRLSPLFLFLLLENNGNLQSKGESRAPAFAGVTSRKTPMAIGAIA